MSLSRADVLKHLSDLGYHDVSDELLEVFVQGNPLFTHSDSFWSDTSCLTF